MGIDLTSEVHANTTHLITEAILKAFLQCPLKAHYLLSGRTPPKNEHAEFDEQVERLHVDKARLALASIFAPEASSAVPLVHEDLSTHADALELVAKRTMVVPIRIFPRAGISDLDRLRLGFDGLVIGHEHGKVFELSGLRGFPRRSPRMKGWALTR